MWKLPLFDAVTHTTMGLYDGIMMESTGKGVSDDLLCAMETGRNEQMLAWQLGRCRPDICLFYVI